MSDHPPSPDLPEPPVPPVNEGAPGAPGAPGANDPHDPAAAVTQGPFDDPHGPATVVPQAAFDGPRGPLLWILVRNLLLNAATLGFFRFWAKTHLRRYFWRHTKLLGEPLEYTGTGGELFIGFLIVMAVLVPLLGGASLLQFLVPHFAVQFLVPAVLFALTPIAIFRMWRYRFTRTLWRGVRFGLDGSSLRYAGLWLGYGALAAVTLGLANPWRRIATTRYLLGHARVGATELRLDVRGGRLFLPWLVVIALLLGAFVALGAANTTAIDAFAAVFADAPGQDPATVQRRLLEAALEIRVWPLLLLILPVVAFARYRAVELRYLLDNLRAGEAELRSNLRTGFFVVVHLAGWTTVFSIMLGLPLALMFVLLVGGAEVDAMSVSIGFAIVWLPLYVLLGLAYTLFVDVTVLAHVCRTLTFENPAALDEIVQSSAAPPRRGEGLADALDVGGF